MPETPYVSEQKEPLCSKPAIEPVNLKLSDILAQQRTDMAAERTTLSVVSTLQAWIRTALSLIGFGFTLYKFLESMQSVEKQILMRPQTPRNMGLILIGLGTASVIFGIIDYWIVIRGMKKKYGIPMKVYPLILALLIAVVGFLLFILITLKLT